MPHPLAGQEILFTQQEHFAKRAGHHYDYRLVLGEHAYSWASKKQVPGPGSAIILFEQPIHDRGYALSPTVEIPDGNYGAGTTHLRFVRKAKVDPESEQDKLVINSGSERYLLKKLDPVRYGEKSWLFKNLAPYKEGPDSTFTHDGNKYRVDDAIAQVAGTKTNKVPVSELKWILKGSKPDKARLLEANPKVPLLITDWQDKKVVIDGFHRLTMAKRLGMDSVSTRWVDTGKLEKVAEVMEKQALNGLKARIMARVAGIIPDAQWKYALRNVRKGTGELMQGAKLRQAKIKMGDLSNNGFQKAKSVDRKLVPDTEFGGRVKKDGGVDYIQNGPKRKKEVAAVINIHSHPGESRFSKANETTYRSDIKHRQATPSGYPQYLESKAVGNSFGGSEEKAKKAKSNLLLQKINVYPGKPSESVSSGLDRINKFTNGSVGDMAFFNTVHMKKPLQRVVAPKHDTVSATSTALKKPSVRSNDKYDEKHRLIYFDHTPRKITKQAGIEEKFKPDFTPAQMEALGVLRHKGSQYGEGTDKDNFFGVRASLDAWPEKWHNEQHPQGWVQWYTGYAAGKRTDDDERQIKRWLSFRARHMGSLTKNNIDLEDPAVRPKQKQALLNWAIGVGDKNKYLTKLKERE